MKYFLISVKTSSTDQSIADRSAVVSILNALESELRKRGALNFFCEGRSKVVENNAERRTMQLT